MKNSEFKKLLEAYYAGTLDKKSEKLLFEKYKFLKDDFNSWDQCILGDKEKLGADILLRVNKEIQRKHRNKIFLSIISIGLLLFGFFSYIKFNQDFLNPRSLYSSKFEKLTPGTDRAILILADGSQIYLDSNENGQIETHDQISIFKSNDGGIIFGNIDNKANLQQLRLSMNTIRTPKAGQFKLVLIDGTKVWLNAMSSISFPSSFSEDVRKVEITGEVYFEVAKDKHKPFKVYSSGQIIEVLGTSFNVNAYPEEGGTRTTLLSGSVKLSNADSLKMVSQKLLPGQQAIMNLKGAGFEIKEVDVENIVGWKNGFFQFNNEDIKTVLRQVERWYDVEIEYRGQIPKTRISGKVNRKVSAHKILDMLAYFGVDYKLDGKKIIIDK